MNRVTFLDHSGYVVTLDKVILVFDYHHDPAHALHRILDANPDKPVVFFVSHYHPDHYNKSIFELAQNHRRTYITSNDVQPKGIPTDLAVAGMSKGDIVDNLPGGLTVKALPSTGPGVSFDITTADGETIFFGGSINDSHSPNAETPDEHRHHTVIFNRIAEGMPEADVAFISMDYLKQEPMPADDTYLLSQIKIKNFIPMETGGNFHGSKDLQKLMPEGTTIHCLRSPGESIEL